jgi:hypothetical protein
MLATLQFAAERRNDYASSNFRPEWTTLETRAEAVEMHDARRLDPPARLDREGFELVRLPAPDPHWSQDDWVQSVYAPLAAQCVLDLTGATRALTFPSSWVLRDTAGKGFAPAAQYVHMDREQENCRALVRAHFGEDAVRAARNFEVINVWRPLTPPPQDVPLALCDQRTTDRDDWLVCQTLEPQLKEEMKHIVPLSNPSNRWYYFSNLTTDEAIVFRNYNDDVHGPAGCPHTAFHDDSVTASVPRASFEIRFYTFYEGERATRGERALFAPR